MGDNMEKSFDSKSFMKYMQACSVSLYICGESLVKNNPKGINWFSLGEEYIEVILPLSEEQMAEEFELETQALRERLEMER